MGLTTEELKEKLSSAKEKVLEAKDAIKDFCKENGLKKNEDHSEHEDSKIAKKYNKLGAELAGAEAKVEKYQGLLKESKGSPKKSGGTGAKVTYVYPAEVKTGDDKKKYRTETRAKCKKLGITTAEYMENPAKHDKSLKVSKKTSKDEVEEKPAKKKTKKVEVPLPKKKKKQAKPEEEPTEGGSTEGGED